MVSCSMRMHQTISKWHLASSSIEVYHVVSDQSSSRRAMVAGQGAPVIRNIRVVSKPSREPQNGGGTGEAKLYGVPMGTL